MCKSETNVAEAIQTDKQTDRQHGSLSEDSYRFGFDEVVGPSREKSLLVDNDKWQRCQRQEHYKQISSWNKL